MLFTKLTTATTFTEMGSLLKTQSFEGKEWQGAIETVATSIVSGLSNILGAAAVTADVVDDASERENGTQKVSIMRVYYSYFSF